MYITPLFFPNLLKLQRKSFLTFLKYGIKKEIKKLDITKNKKKLLVYPNLFQLNLPTYTCNECVITSKTYNCELVIPIRLISYKDEIEWITLTNIPIMTNKCNFITNGSPRVIMSQITRAPGIYYHKENENTYYADIIAERGNWLRIEIDKKNNIWMKVKKVPKVPALMFLQALGVTKSNLIKLLKYPIPNQNHNLGNFKSQKEALEKIELYSQLESSINSRNLKNQNKITIFDRFMNPKYYDLGTRGRIQINKKFNNIEETIQHSTLTSKDFILAVHFLLKIKYKIEETDDIDNLKNKRVKIAGELIQSQFGIGILRLQKYVKDKLGNIKNNLHLTNIFSSTPINTTLAEFFGVNPLSQFMDEVNPLATLTHKRRLSSLGIGGVNRDTATLTIRSIHPTLYGRICPIETPEGKNAGLVNSFALFAEINSEGLIETPFFRVCNGRILYEMGINYLSANQEDKSNIVPFDIKKSRIGFLSKNKIAARIKQQLKEVSKKKVDFISISQLQMLSVATSLIPFMEHNDANRVLMGSNMQRQAVPLLKTECCLVGTGLETKIFFDLQDNVKSPSNGFISYLSLKKITISNIRNEHKSFNFKSNPLETITCIKSKSRNFNRLKYNLKDLLTNSKESLKITNYMSYVREQKIQYYIKQYNSSNQGTCSVNRLTLNEGQFIIKKNPLISGLSSCRNELALGKNLFVGYISWKGYNFEDAIVLNEQLVINNIYTSTHLEKFETEIKKNKENSEIITRDIKNISFLNKKNLDKNGIIKIGSRVFSDDILVGKLLPIETRILSPYRKLLYEILQKQNDHYRNTSLRVPKYKRGRITFVDYIKDKGKIKKKTEILKDLKTIKIHLMQNRLIQIGDKISGRHGNKGVISKILKIQEMPYLNDGIPLDILLNPLGVPSRMNIGQVLECLLGLSCFYLQRRFKVIPFDESFGFEVSRNFIYSNLYFSNIKTGNNWLLHPYYPGKNRIFDSYSGLPFDQPITIGKAYILKLIHLVEEKVHARSTGSYSLVTQQPLKGKSKKGGQRVGEMEVWALEGYGAAYTLHEILTVKSDDIKSRQKVLTSILNSETIKFGTTETFKVLIRELQSLCLNIQFFK